MTRPTRALMATLALLLWSQPVLADGSAPRLAAHTAAGTESAGADPSHATVAQRIERLHAVLLDVMKSAEAGADFAGRRDELEPVLLESFDLPFMAQKSVGRHWKKVSTSSARSASETFFQWRPTDFSAMKGRS